MKRFCAGATAGIMLAATAWVGGTGAAMADYQSDRDALCGPGDLNACSITIREKDWDLTEGVSSATVDVVGTPGVSSELKMYTVVLSQTPLYLDLIKSWGTPVPFTTDAAGKATVTVKIATLTAPWGALNPVVFQLAGSTRDQMNSQSIRAVVDSGIPDTIRVRSARGAFANYNETITDGLLGARVAGGLTGDVYGVQIARLEGNGAWRDVTNLGIKNNGRIGKDGQTIVHADVAGYADGTYRVRVFNRTRGIYDLPLDTFNQGLVDLEKNIYTTPGEHLKNGRKWRTTCEGYSQTQRCRTEIWSTQVVYVKGTLVKNTGWHFNNLTYKASARALWKGNPLGNTGNYTISGRAWRTECDTPVSGGNGCRSYVVSSVVVATKKGSGYTYSVVTKEVFNNIVLFEGAK